MSTIQFGDHVIIYSSREQMDSIILTRGQQFQSKYGHYKHDLMEHTLYGSKFSSANGRGFVFLLRPTPELWTLALPHRTQILYMPDIAFITSFLDIKPASVVIEAGTGSGSFSHAIARSVGSTGAVHSFEYHEERYIKAGDEFKLHGLSDVITLRHRNVCKDGFELVDAADSVFLDVPAPWEAISHAKISLRKDRQSRICCFSPCIEQVLKTVAALRDQGFSDITTYECLSRTHDGTPYIAPDVSSAIERIETVESKKKKRREGQIEEAKLKRDDNKRKREAIAASARIEVEAKKVEEDRLIAEGDEGKDGVVERVKEEEEGVGGEGEEGEPLRKKVKGNNHDEDDIEMAVIPSLPLSTLLPLPLPLSISLAPSASTSTANSPSPAPVSHSIAPSSHTHNGTTTTKLESTAAGLPKKITTFKAGPQTRGHTSYLTFATLLSLGTTPLTSSRSISRVASPVAAAAAVVVGSGEGAGVEVVEKKKEEML